MISKLNVFFILSVIIFGCSTTKFTKNDIKVFPPLIQGSENLFLTQDDSIPTNIIKVGEFKHLEDKNLTWHHMKTKILNNALMNGANVIKIDKYYVLAVNTDGHSAKITGRYYRSDNLDKIKEYQSQNEYNRSICIFRNEGSAILRSVFPIKIFLDGKEVGDLPNNTFYILNTGNSDKHILSTSKDGANSLEINFEINQNIYISVSQNLSSSNIGASVGNKYFHVFDNLEGRLNFETVKNEGKQNIVSQ